MRKIGDLERLDDAVETDVRHESEQLLAAQQEGSAENLIPVRVGAAERDDLDVLELVPEQEKRPKRRTDEDKGTPPSSPLGAFTPRAE